MVLTNYYNSKVTNVFLRQIPIHSMQQPQCWTSSFCFVFVVVVADIVIVIVVIIVIIIIIVVVINVIIIILLWYVDKTVHTTIRRVCTVTKWSNVRVLLWALPDNCMWHH